MDNQSTPLLKRAEVLRAPEETIDLQADLIRRPSLRISISIAAEPSLLFHVQSVSIEYDIPLHRMVLHPTYLGQKQENTPRELSDETTPHQSAWGARIDLIPIKFDPHQKPLPALIYS